MVDQNKKFLQYKNFLYWFFYFIFLLQHNETFWKIIWWVWFQVFNFSKVSAKKFYLRLMGSTVYPKYLKLDIFLFRYIYFKLFKSLNINFFKLFNDFLKLEQTKTTMNLYNRYKRFFRNYSNAFLEARARFISAYILEIRHSKEGLYFHKLFRNSTDKDEKRYWFYYRKKHVRIFLKQTKIKKKGRWGRRKHTFYVSLFSQSYYKPCTQPLIAQKHFKSYIYIKFNVPWKWRYELQFITDWRAKYFRAYIHNFQVIRGYLFFFGQYIRRQRIWWSRYWPWKNKKYFLRRRRRFVIKKRPKGSRRRFFKGELIFILPRKKLRFNKKYYFRYLFPKNNVVTHLLERGLFKKNLRVQLNFFLFFKKKFNLMVVHLNYIFLKYIPFFKIIPSKRSGRTVPIIVRLNFYQGINMFFVKFFKFLSLRSEYTLYLRYLGEFLDLLKFRGEYISWRNNLHIFVFSNLETLYRTKWLRR